MAAVDGALEKSGQGNGDRKELQWQHWDEMGCPALRRGHGLQQDQQRGDRGWRVISRGSQCHGPGGLGWGSRGIPPFGGKEGVCHRVALLCQGWLSGLAGPALRNEHWAPSPSLWRVRVSARAWRFPGEILHRAPSSAAGVARSSAHGHEPRLLLGGPTSPRPLQSHLVSRQQGPWLVLPEAQSQGLPTSGREVPSRFLCRWKSCPHPIFLLLKLMAGSRPCKLASPLLLFSLGKFWISSKPELPDALQLVPPLHVSVRGYWGHFQCSPE